MAFHEIGKETTTAPRNLTRAGQTAKRIQTPWYAYDQAAPPASVGGTAETTHVIWRCGHCRALAVAAEGTSPPSKCGKCGC